MKTKEPLAFPDHRYYFILLPLAHYPRAVDDATAVSSQAFQREHYWRHPKHDVEMLKWSSGESPKSGITVIAGEHVDGVMIQVSAPPHCVEEAEKLVDQLLLNGVLVQRANAPRTERLK